VFLRFVESHMSRADRAGATRRMMDLQYRESMMICRVPKANGRKFSSVGACFNRRGIHPGYGSVRRVTLSVRTEPLAHNDWRLA
jgi:hypothetical protein